MLTALLYNVVDKVAETYLYYTYYLEVIFKSQEEWIKEQVTWDLEDSDYGNSSGLGSEKESTPLDKEGEVTNPYCYRAFISPLRSLKEGADRAINQVIARVK